MPVTKARPILGDLVGKVSGNDYIILTKGGMPEAAVVDLEYLTKLEKEIEKIYSKTYIDPKLLPYTREFSDKEIKKWLEEDKLQ
ncbi:hypothetical protein A3D00_03630 [Candidatus Woesebacteria bacterium RIFCSPHIGHO2_02_FULL_38_9]|uniref:Antitoxin n=1 Tax=Candidatus Woesebacteria bacterium RIFCSPHIGHO2_01_FULL_39_28 TaxID=1802496 RepID=A0A1F7YGW6_9BACT|nr:MAG: hypothetical protein A2627_00955 [Candidatus Woesebacteria bacterium RIFCSPHIGHO2_01_FULL_39_28]OGM32585.1 MAG: hypothetical protein A3D00_03630 [Candidatus Woesebacteria bacterium RIFCSPHIGHO2_02_FULL_38_9]OGM58715.1 MAG: hypothetical protein A3A50_02905 [Candidatus Woesebacteria bacterium RIFCSPLOWO2_01_FULL_38_20]